MDKLKSFFSYQRSIIAIKIWIGSIVFFILIISFLFYFPNKQNLSFFSLLGIDVTIGILAFCFFWLHLFIKDKYFRILTLLALLCIATPIGYGFYEGNKEFQQNQRTQSETQSKPVPEIKNIQPEQIKTPATKTEKPIVKKPNPTPSPTAQKPKEKPKKEKKEKKEKIEDDDSYVPGVYDPILDVQMRRIEDDNERMKEGRKRMNDYKAAHPDMTCLFDTDGIPTGGCVKKGS